MKRLSYCVSEARDTVQGSRFAETSRSRDRRARDEPVSRSYNDRRAPVLCAEPRPGDEAVDAAARRVRAPDARAAAGRRRHGGGVRRPRARVRGAWCCARDRRDARVQIVSRVEPAAEPGVALTLAQAVLKGDKMDDIVRDAVMLGVAAVQPLVTTRSGNDRGGARARRASDRWRARGARVGEAVGRRGASRDPEAANARDVPRRPGGGPRADARRAGAPTPTSSRCRCCAIGAAPQDAAILDRARRRLDGAGVDDGARPGRAPR